MQRTILVAAILGWTTFAAAEMPPLVGAFTQTSDWMFVTPAWQGHATAADAEFRAHFETDLARVMTAGVDEEVLNEPDATDRIARRSMLPVVLTPTTSVSLGKANRGYLVNGVPLPTTDRIASRPGKNYGTRESVEMIIAATDAVHTEHADTPILAVGDLSRKSGGRFRPHKSHQSGRDADIAYFIKNKVTRRLGRATTETLDVPRTWTFMAYFLERELTEYIFVDYRLQRVLYEYARDVKAVPPGRLEEMFQYPRGRSKRKGIIRHSKGHDDHMHVRFHSPHAVAAARLYLDKHGTDVVKPLPVYYRARKGDSVSRVARRHKVKRKVLRKWNNWRRRGRVRLRRGQQIIVGWRRPKLPKVSDG